MGITVTVLNHQNAVFNDLGSYNIKLFDCNYF